MPLVFTTLKLRKETFEDSIIWEGLSKTKIHGKILDEFALSDNVLLSIRCIPSYPSLLCPRMFQLTINQ